MASIQCSFKSLCSDLPVYNISSEEADLDCFTALSINHNTDGGVIPLLTEESEIESCNEIYESCESQAEADELAEEAFIDCVSGLIDIIVIESVVASGIEAYLDGVAYDGYIEFSLPSSFTPPSDGVLLLANQGGEPAGGVPPNTVAKVGLWGAFDVQYLSDIFVEEIDSRKYYKFPIFPYWHDNIEYRIAIVLDATVDEFAGSNYYKIYEDELVTFPFLTAPTLTAVAPKTVRHSGQVFPMLSPLCPDIEIWKSLNGGAYALWYTGVCVTVGTADVTDSGLTAGNSANYKARFRYVSGYVTDFSNVINLAP